MEKKVKQIVDWIVKDACENSASGDWSITTDDIRREFGFSWCEYIAILGCVIEELCNRPEVVDVVNTGSGTLDLGIDTDYCKKFEGRRFEYKDGELKKK